MSDEAGTVNYDFDKIRWVFFVAAGAGGVYMCLALHVFRMRWGLFPLKGREPILSFMCGIILAVYATSTAVKYGTRHFPCWLTYWQGVVAHGFGMAIYTVRGCLLLFRYELAMAQMSGEVALEDNRRSSRLRTLSAVDVESQAPARINSETQDESEKSEVSVSRTSDSERRSSRHNSSSLSRRSSAADMAGMRYDERYYWYLDHRHLVQPRYLVALLLALGFLYTAPFAAVFAVVAPSEDGETQCLRYEEGDFYVLGQAVFMVAPVLYLAHHMRDVVDFFRIKEELRLISYWGLGWGLVWFVLVLDRATTNDYFPFHALAILVLLHGVFAITIVIPLRRSYEDNSDKIPNAPKDISSLKGVLEDPVGYRLFRKHLSNEFALENLIFYEEVEDFRLRAQRLEAAIAEQDVGPDAELERQKDSLLAADSLRRQMCKLALDVYRRCIVKGSMSEINIPYTLRDDIETAVTSCMPLLDIELYKTARALRRRRRRLKGPSRHRRAAPLTKRISGVFPELEAVEMKRKPDRSATHNPTTELAKMPSSSHIASPARSVTVKAGRKHSSRASTLLGMADATDEELVEALKQDLRVLQQISSAFYDKAQQNIYDLMERDTFTRFALSPAYITLIERYQEQLVQHGVLRSFQGDERATL